MKTLIIAEKPSLAKNIAEALHCNITKQGYIQNADESIYVTWQFGHLLELYDVAEYKFGENTKEKLKWSDIQLPFIPDDFKYKPKKNDGVKKQLQIIKGLMNNVDRIVNAGDADREGQLLIDNTLIYLKCSKPVYRLWLPEQTTNVIQQEYKNMKKNSDFKNLLNEGFSRTFMDWMFGINLTIYGTVKTNTLLKIGSVIVPTVKYVYDREMAIRNFVSEKYFQNENSLGCTLTCKEKFKNESDADTQNTMLNNIGVAVVKGVNSKPIKKQSPKLYSLNKLQSECSKRLKLSMKKSADVIQSLYEKKLITYPRTNTEYLGENEKDKVKNIISMLGNNDLVFKDNKSIFDSSKVESHSAITPTGMRASGLVGSEADVYNLIYNRFCAVFCREDTIVEQTVMNIFVGNYEFVLKGEVLKQNGFYKYEPKNLSNNLPDFKVGDSFKVKFKKLSKDTKPPAKATITDLLEYLENPFKKELKSENDDEEYKLLLSGVSIGTPATRGGIIEKCIDNLYFSQTKGGTLNLLEKGEYFINTLDLLKINLYKDKSVEMNKLLKEVELGKKTINDVIFKVQTELSNIISNSVDVTLFTGKNTKGGKNMTEKEYFTGNWKGNNVKFNRNWSTHRFTDEECQKLLNGETITFSFKNSKGGMSKVKGRLNNLEFNGRKYVGFENLGFVPEIPTKWCEHTFTDDERRLLEDGSELYIEDFISKNGNQFPATIKWGVDPNDNRTKILFVNN